MFLRETADLKVGHNLILREGVSSGNSTGFATGTIDAHDLNLRTTWANGARAALFARPEASAMDMRLYYSYYGSMGSRTWNGIATPNPFVPGFEVGNIVNTVILNSVDFTTPVTLITSLTGFYRVRIQEYGIDFCYPIDGRFLFKPYIGLKGIVIEQGLDFEHSFIRINTQNMVNLYEAFHQYTQMNGFGLSGGMHGEFVILAGLKGFGQVGSALVWGRKKWLGKGHATLSEVIEETTSVAFRRNWSTLNLSLDGAFGLLYETPPFFQCMRALFKIAWENRIYFKQNFFAATLDPEELDRPQNDVSTYGLVFTGMVLF